MCANTQQCSFNVYCISFNGHSHFILPYLVQVGELEVSLQGLESERDFYFGKLRDIEVICQQNEGQPIMQDILDIMYATQVSGRVSVVQ